MLILDILVKIKITTGWFKDDEKVVDYHELFEREEECRSC